MNIPDSWESVTFAQFMRIQPGMAVTEILSILLNKPENEVMTMNLDLEAALKRLSFLNDTITQTVSGPDDIELEAVGRYEDMRLYTKQFKGDATDFQHYPVIFATYWQRPYHAETVDGLIKYVEQKPCGVVLGTVQHYLKQIERIEEKWKKLFPQGGYTPEQINAGYQQMDEFFGFFGTLLYMEESTKYSRDDLLKWTVAEFKYNLLYLARRNEAGKKYSDAQSEKMRAKTTRR